MNGQTTIYSLSDPRTNEVRYIGKTVQSLNTRLRSHITDSARTNNHRSNWIRSLPNEPLIQRLLSVPDELAPHAERYAIAIYRSMKYRLTNQTDGGEGCSGRVVAPETRAKLSASLKGLQLTPEQRARQVAALTGRKLSPEHIAKRSAATKGRVISAETRAKLSAAKRGKKMPPLTNEHRAKLSAAGKGRVVSAETRAKISLAHKGRPRPPVSPETRAKMGATRKGRKYSLEHRAKISKALMGNKNGVGRRQPQRTEAK